MNKKYTIVAILMAFAITTRIIPHYPNFTAMGAVALLGGAMLKNPFQALLVVLSSLFLGDIIINNMIYPSDGFVLFYNGAGYIYASYALILLIGYFIKNLQVKSYAVTSVFASILFFLITNYSVWASGLMYPKTQQGLIAAYAAGLPYALNDLLSTLMYGVAIVTLYKVLVNELNLKFARV